MEPPSHTSYRYAGSLYNPKGTWKVPVPFCECHMENCRECQVFPHKIPWQPYSPSLRGPPPQFSLQSR
ncbi:hypothetical protein FR483_n343R [Paramecium bursaria Chlorella virus FR483]|uniref:Uncharacterized protein n343R n=1 Tax=Paramecium bursaria Chlorella virus FR483 TaxID=399781 RepID=A7J747_PBCVF|nr:hypothetical protein FR483_n343R [Paramecium bursaria Chlorella virus FR483]ABT15628.1 hypothetical protein FR483_n343R [Paramecium bursaria Chlorella virus FR483]